MAFSEYQADRIRQRLSKAQLVFKKGSREIDFAGRVMRGFLLIVPEGFDSDNDLDFWIEKAFYFNKEIS